MQMLAANLITLAAAPLILIGFFVMARGAFRS
jgi:hypothetical protein